MPNEKTLPPFETKKIIPFPVTIDENRAADSYAKSLPEYLSKGGNTAIPIYKEQPTPETEYEISRFQDHFRFQLVHDGTIIAKFVVRDNASVLNLEHRQVESQKFGVTGTAFLQKAEAYLRWLKKSNHIDQDEPLIIDAGQQGVILWALKNGFTFIDPAEESLFKKIIDERPEEYETGIKDRAEKFVREGYIMEKMKYLEWRKKNAEGKLKDKKPMPARTFAVRFHLRKGI